MNIQNYISLFKMGERQVLDAVQKRLRGHGYTVSRASNYIYARGVLPVLMVAHADTVFEPRKFTRRIEVFHDWKRSVLWSPSGLGADDRAGVIGILELLQMGYRPHVLITLGEEMGGIGAQEFGDHLGEDTRASDIKYMLEIDRAGGGEAVFYACDRENEAWEKYVLSYGFRYGLGTYSDVDTIMEDTEICGANLSAGYYNNHTPQVYLNYAELQITINRVARMLKGVGKVDRRFLFTMHHRYKYQMFRGYPDVQDYYYGAGEGSEDSDRF